VGQAQGERGPARPHPGEGQSCESWPRSRSRLSPEAGRSKDGSIGELIQSTTERWKPEAMYLGTFDGHRTAFMVFDIPDSSDMVPFGEPFFMALDADVEVVPVMNADDLQKGFGKLG
jgi:hypothetical protein